MYCGVGKLSWLASGWEWCWVAPMPGLAVASASSTHEKIKWPPHKSLMTTRSILPTSSPTLQEFHFLSINGENMASSRNRCNNTSNKTSYRGLEQKNEKLSPDSILLDRRTTQDSMPFCSNYYRSHGGVPQAGFELYLFTPAHTNRPGRLSELLISK